MNKSFVKALSLKLLPVIIPLAILLFWQISVSLKLIEAYRLPSPFKILQSAKTYIFEYGTNKPFSARFLSDIFASSIRVLAGFSVSSLLGIILGMASGRSKIFNKLFGTTLNAVRAVPGIAWLPLSMIWFGIGFKVTLFLIALAAFFPVYLNTSSAAQNFDQRLIKTGRMLGLDKLRCLIYILIPGCLPQISSGLRLALGISWAYLVLGELTGVSEGLGAFIMDARLAGRVDMIIVGILIIALAGKISDMLLKIALKLSFKSLRRAN